MGVIQNSINQLLGTSALATKLSPTAQDKVELRGLEKGAKNLEDAKRANFKAGLSAVGKIYKDNPELKEQFEKLKTDEEKKQFSLEHTPTSFLQTSYDLMNEQTSNISDRLKLKPDKELASDWQKIEEKKSVIGNELTFRKEEAMAKMKEKIKAGLEQGDDFDTFKKNLFLQGEPVPESVALVAWNQQQQKKKETK